VSENYAIRLFNDYGLTVDEEAYIFPMYRFGMIAQNVYADADYPSTTYMQITPQSGGAIWYPWGQSGDEMIPWLGSLYVYDEILDA
jgi:hypothetical protein